MIHEEEISELLAGFKRYQSFMVAIGDEVRQHIIIGMLSANIGGRCNCGGIRVGDIAAMTSLSRPAVSHHLQIIKHAGILNVRREGTKNYYYFESDVKEIEGFISLMTNIKRVMQRLPDRSGEL